MRLKREKTDFLMRPLRGRAGVRTASSREVHAPRAASHPRGWGLECARRPGRSG
jgi:hypothetical protein